MNHVSDDQEITKLVRWLEHHYAAKILQVRTLTSGDKRVYRVETDSGHEWIVRLYALPGEDGYPPPIGPLVDVLLFLEAHEYPAERVVRTAEGLAFAPHPEAQAFVTGHLGATLRPWQPQTAQNDITPASLTDVPCEATPEVFFALGEALGRLHSLPVNTEGALRQAGMLPAKELAWVSSHLAEAYRHVPDAYRAEYEQLMTALQRSNRCENLPVALIHNDCNLGNIARTPA